MEKLVGKRLMQVAFVLALGLLAPMLDTTMTNIAVDSIGRDIGATLDQTQWIMTAYILATAVAVPFSGWLGQHFSAKNMYFLAEVAFLGASIMAALSQNITWLISARIVQGFAGGLMMPLATTMLGILSDKDNRKNVMLVVMMTVMAGPVLGPVVGAIIVNATTWQWIFWVNIPVMLLAATLNVIYLPKLKGFNPNAKIDLAGILLLAGSSASLIYALSRAGAQATFANSDTQWFGGFGIAGIVIYIVWALVRKQASVMPLGLFTRKVYVSVVIDLFLNGLITTGPMLILPLYFQTARGMSVLDAGLWMLPQGIGLLVMRPVLSKLMAKIGARYVVLLALVLLVIGTFPAQWLTLHTNLWLIAGVLFVRGMGMGMVITPLRTAFLDDMPKALLPQANIGTQLFQNLGSSFGGAVLAMIVITYMTSHKTSIVQHGLAQVALHGYQQAFLWVTVITIVMAFPALWLPKKV